MPLTPPTAWVDPQGRYLLLRPQRPDDAALLGTLWNAGLSAAARFNRFQGRSDLLGATAIDEQSAVADGQAWLITERLPGGERALAEGRWTPVGRCGEGLLALAVMTRCQRQGLGRQLLQALLRSAQKAGLHGLSLHALEANIAVLRLACQRGFERQADAPASPWVRLHYRFQARPAMTPLRALQITEEHFHV